MAILIPETPKDCTRSERIVYERLGAELDKQWFVLHSLGLVDHATKRRGEADIVVLSEWGIFVLEVKGGRVSCKDGVWSFGAPGYDPIQRREDPWSQASGAMFAVIDRVRKAAPELEGLLFGFGVVMPMEHFTTHGAEIDQQVLLDSRDFHRNLSLYIKRLERRWLQIHAERGLRPPRTPTLAEIRKIRRILRPDVESAFSLGSWLSGLDQHLLELTNEQIRISRRLASNSRMIVRGKAGTGKTILAVHRALHLGEQGFRVLFLCFNQLLAKHISDSIKGQPGSVAVTVRHLHAHYRDTIDRASLSERLNDRDLEDATFYGKEFPLVYCDALMKLDAPPFDAVVVDEAQDILTPQHMDALDLTVDGGLDNGRWHLFLDPQQNIYGQLSELAEHRLERISIARDELLDNCRNTREVAYQTSVLSTLEVAVEGAPAGPACECVFYRDRADGIATLEAELRRLVSRDVDPREIVILSTRRRENSLIAGHDVLAGLKVRDAAEGPATKSIAFSTMQAFKGLERSVVIAIDLDEIGSQSWAMIHYAGLSRARTLLIPLLSKSCEKSYRGLVEAFGRRISRR